MFGQRTMVSWWSRCAAAERLQRIENAAEPIRAASAAGSEVGGLPDAAERHQDPAVAAQFDPLLTQVAPH